MIPAIIKLNEKVRELEDQIKALKRDSHPPVMMLECPICHALYPQGRGQRHATYHQINDGVPLTRLMRYEWD